MHQLYRWLQSPLLLILPHLLKMILSHTICRLAIFLVLSRSSGRSIYLTNLQIDNLLALLLQLLAATMSWLKMEPSTRRSIPMNTPTHKTVAGSSLFPTDMEFISTSPYFRLSLWLITSLSGESGDTHTHLLASAPASFLALACVLGLILHHSLVPFKTTYSLSSLCTLITGRSSFTFCLSFYRLCALFDRL